jgi:hypothetical protein
MFNIADYLKRAVGIIDKGTLDTQGVADVITKHTGISKNNIFFNIKDGVLRTTLSPAEKMMLFMKKEAVLGDLASFYVKDIR